MDQLDGFLQSQVVEGLTSAELHSVRVAGLLLPALLFADDLLLLSSHCKVVQQLLDALSVFGRVNGLSVNLPKTMWPVGGWVAADGPAGELCFECAPLAWVECFCYLALEFDGRPQLTLMREARLTAARKAWGVL